MATLQISTIYRFRYVVCNLPVTHEHKTLRHQISERDLFQMVVMYNNPSCRKLGQFKNLSSKKLGQFKEKKVHFWSCTIMSYVFCVHVYLSFITRVVSKKMSIGNNGIEQKVDVFAYFSHYLKQVIFQESGNVKFCYLGSRAIFWHFEVTFDHECIKIIDILIFIMENRTAFTVLRLNHPIFRVTISIWDNFQIKVMKKWHARKSIG